MDLPWLEAPLQRILALHAQSRLPHALLLKANEGWGEVELASQLALTLLDQAGPGDARSLAHPDLRWIEPEGSVIKVDDIRELATFAIGTRQSAPCKVAVVEAADLMNPNAANALLKTLEEPPADTYLLLTTCRSARLLPTIVSRCQAVAVTRDDESARSWLLKRWSADEIEEKLFECGDAPLMVDDALAAAEPALGPLLETLANHGSVSAQVAPLLEWNVDRLTSSWYRHCLALLAGAGRIDLEVADSRALAGFVDELKAVRYQLLMTNSANQRLLYERLTAKWYGLFSGGRSRRPV
jgi:hypothetical protein